MISASCAWEDSGPIRETFSWRDNLCEFASQIFDSSEIELNRIGARHLFFEQQLLFPLRSSPTHQLGQISIKALSHANNNCAPFSKYLNIAPLSEDRFLRLDSEKISSHRWRTTKCFVAEHSNPLANHTILRNSSVIRSKHYATTSVSTICLGEEAVKFMKVTSTSWVPAPEAQLNSTATARKATFHMLQSTLYGSQMQAVLRRHNLCGSSKCQF